jgi:trehalose/maltose transport system permease protein
VATTAQSLQPSLGLRLLNGGFMALWTLVALFPMVWIATMSFRAPVDALAVNPLTVITGPTTLAQDGGLSLVAIALGIVALVLLVRAPSRVAPPVLARAGRPWLGWLVAVGLLAVLAAVGLFVALPLAVRGAEWLLRPIPLVGAIAEPLIGVTLDHYRAVWVTYEFHRNFLNSMIVTFGVVTVSLTVGTLAGYALARSGSNLAFWLLIIALVFRALPHSVLVTGYVPFFLQSREILAPLWEWAATGWFFRLFSATPPTLYGQPLAIILVLVSINQPFTIWMMRSFFANIPRELDEAARVDGCGYLGAFRRVIMPVMWPGVLTTGLFSFLLAYNDYLVTALLLDAQSQTMVPAISQFLNRDTRAADQIEAIAAAVSIAAPLFLLVMVFQKQIVAGLTQGAVKG